MRFSLTSLVRLVGLLGFAVCGLAITLARLEPDAARFRVGTPPQYDLVNGFIIDPAGAPSRWLDVDSGETLPVGLPEGEQVNYASCAPWQDEEGKTQVVGRWNDHVRTPSGILARRFGIVRFTIPGGEVLDRISLEVLPTSQPCWFPGMKSRVLFGGCDGRLYTLDFDGPARTGETPAPTQVVWRVPAPGGQLMLRDPVWPADPRFRGRVLVALSYTTPESQGELCPSQLWWLDLDSRGTSILGAGRVTDEPLTPNSREERFPNVVVDADGRTTIAFLTQTDEKSRWELRVAPLRFEGQDELPAVRKGEARLLTRDHLTTLPPFSADGRHINAIVREGFSPRAVTRFMRFSTASADQPPRG
ncbi:MAG: hypothetical protein U0835_17685 [Isosphaeraceae bacterium]